MFFRIRTRLTDRPGALAALAVRCGEAGVNILGLQLFPDLGSVTDELVVMTPDGWTTATVLDLVGGAGGDEVSVEPCTTHDLVDQPTRWLTAARDLIEDPDLLPSVLGALVGPESTWSATEHVRAAMLTEIAEVVRRPVSTVAEAGSANGGSGVHGGSESSDVVTYETTSSGVDARIGGHVVGAASLTQDAPHQVTVEVAPAWRRLGIGTSLLAHAARVLRERGAEEMVLLAPAGDEAAQPMIAAAGLRGILKVSEGRLSARIGLIALRPAGWPSPGDLAASR